MAEIRYPSSFSREEIAFYEAMTKEPTGVFVVELHRKNGGVNAAVFSSYESTRKWLDEASDEDVAVITPFIVDEPAFGNMPRSKIN